MANAFSERTNFNEDISGWDVSNVLGFGGMFRRAESFNQDLGGWDTSSANEMQQMFYEAKSFNHFIGDWNTSSVTNLNYMFSFADLFNQDVSGWDVSLVTEMNKMFHRAESLSDLNKRLIHESFSSNPNWPYDWGDDEPHDEPGDGGTGSGGGNEGTDPEDINETVEPEPELYELALRGSLVMENLPAGTVVGSLEVIAESGGDATTDFDFELIGIDGNPLSAGEGGPSPVNGITSLTFERSRSPCRI